MENATQAAIAFINEASKALQQVNVDCPDSKLYINTLVKEMESAKLRPNPSFTGGTPKFSNWESAIREARRYCPSVLLDTVIKLEHYVNWVSATRFWPEEEYRHFANNLSGLHLIGQDEAFTSENKYVVLLGVMSPGTTYPLHEHRIKELYYVVGGEAGWSRDAKRWITLSPGSVFFNRSSEPHAIRTYNQYLIFISFYLPPFGWEGGMVKSD